MSGSYKVTMATRGSALEPLERWLLTCLAMRAGDDGECWASVATLVDDSGLSERAVQETLRKLTGWGVLDRQDRPGTSAVYRVKAETIPPKGTERPAAANPRTRRTPAPGAPVHHAHPTPAPGAPPPPHRAHPTPAPGAPNTSSDPSSDPSTDPRADDRPPELATREPEAAPAPPPPPPAQPVLVEAEDAFDRLLARWNLIPGRLPKSNKAAKVHRAESKAGRALRARLNEHGPELVGLVLDWFEHSPDAEWGRDPRNGRNGLGLLSLMYPQQFPGYADDAEAWKRSKAAAEAAPPPAPPPTPARSAPVAAPSPGTSGSVIPLRRPLVLP